jgi:hypothetical protein
MDKATMMTSKGPKKGCNALDVPKVMDPPPSGKTHRHNCPEEAPNFESHCESLPLFDLTLRRVCEATDVGGESFIEGDNDCKSSFPPLPSNISYRGIHHSNISYYFGIQTMMMSRPVPTSSHILPQQPMLSQRLVLPIPR